LSKPNLDLIAEFSILQSNWFLPDNWGLQMNLDLSLLGWTHTVACLCALATGFIVLARPKGTSRHRLFGHLYLISMLVTNFTAFGIYRQGVFYRPHWFAVAALIAVTIGFLCVRLRRPRAYWLHVHLTGMVASYYILIGGGVNEVFLRIDVLHAMAPHVNNSPLVGMTHLIVMAGFVLLIGYFNVRYRRRARFGLTGATPAAPH
jgi:uncharacterized membrane protein